MERLIVCALFVLNTWSVNSKVTVSIGIITFPYAPLGHLTNLSTDVIAQLKTDGHLSNDVELQTYVDQQLYCSESQYQGLHSMAQMYFLNDVSVFVGPPCIGDLQVLVNTTDQWSAVFASTVFQMTPTDNVVVTFENLLHEMALLQLATLFKWNTVALVCAAYSVSIFRMMSGKKYLTDNGMSVLDHAFPVGGSVQNIIDSGVLQSFTKQTGIFVVYDIDSDNNTFSILSAMDSLNLTAQSRYVRIVVHTGMALPSSKLSYFDYTFLIYGSVAETDIKATLFSRFPEISAPSLNNQDTSVNIWNSVYLFGWAVQQIYNLGHSITPESIFNTTKNADLKSVFGNISMDQNAQRAPSAFVDFLTPNSAPVRVLDILSRRGPDCFNATEFLQPSCFIPEITVRNSTPWFDDQGVPRDEPECGFDGKWCSSVDTVLHQVFISMGIVCTAVAVSLTMLAIIAYSWKKLKEREMYRMPWRINRDHLTSNFHSKTLSLRSLSTGHTGHTGQSAPMRRGRNTMVMIGTTMAYTRIYDQNRNLNLTRRHLNLLNELNRLSHECLNTFIGLSFNQNATMVIVWKACPRGSLEDIIFHGSLNLETIFKSSFLRDIAKGLEYLHMGPVEYHGMLNLTNCLVESHWTVKLSGFGIDRVVNDLVKHNEIVLPADKKPKAHDLMHVAPEYLRLARDESGRIYGSQEGDIYGLAYIFYQIMYERQLYDQNFISEWDFVEQLTFPNGVVVRPLIPTEPVYPTDAVQLLKRCWDEEREKRPSIKHIRRIVEESFKNNAGSVVDHMMKMMEKYAGNLEKLVDERTSKLEETQARADALLAQMLPRSIVEELKMGRSVQPTLYQTATVLFSDIVEFTTLCSDSSPFEIVNFLNELYSGFDAIIAVHDVYKVETIGDAYMVVSGLPERNGPRHVKEIAELAIGMLNKISTFQVPHRPKLKLKLRVGFHSGPVAAGVVGMKTPRYCLFGDTVNMASRMESSGEPMKIQISTNSKLLLDKWTQYYTSIRGTVDIKGKGQCTTYWLDGKADVEADISARMPNSTRSSVSQSSMKI